MPANFAVAYASAEDNMSNYVALLGAKSSAKHPSCYRPLTPQCYPGGQVLGTPTAAGP